MESRQMFQCVLYVLLNTVNVFCIFWGGKKTMLTYNF